MRSSRAVLVLASVAVTCLLAYGVQNQTSVPLPPATEAPAGFDNQTNGLVDQAKFDADRDTFNEEEEISDGLGPVYNARSCGGCHDNPVTGGSSQVTELRAGHYDGHSFFDHPGGSLINDRAINPLIQERVLGGNEVRTFR